jgi:hypothetical protein
MHSSFLVMAAVVGVAALLVPLFARGRDGAQLRAGRRLGNVLDARLRSQEKLMNGEAMK